MYLWSEGEVKHELNSGSLATSLFRKKRPCMKQGGSGLHGEHFDNKAIRKPTDCKFNMQTSCAAGLFLASQQNSVFYT